MTSEFASSMAADLKAFLVFKRALGFPYRRAEFTLRAFDRFLRERERSARAHRLDEAMLAWLGRNTLRKPVSVAGELAVLRQFHSFLLRQGRRGLRIPDWPRVPATSSYVPHVFTAAEVRQLLRLTGELPRRFLPAIYRALLLVLYCTGLRFGEAVRLRMRDVDLARGTLFITESKGRARWVPYHLSLGGELKRYLGIRAKLAPVRPDDSFFVDSNGAALSRSKASLTVSGLLKLAGLKPATGRVGPRPYDFRHAFAVHRLTRWYHAGVDLHSRLPWLSAYMGHDDLLGTETYLTATPELLSLAGERFHRRAFPRGQR